MAHHAHDWGCDHMNIGAEEHLIGYWPLIQTGSTHYSPAANMAVRAPQKDNSNGVIRYTLFSRGHSCVGTCALNVIFHAIFQ
jgi:hypothetical protein